MLAKLHPEAEDELNEAVKYYETKSYGLGSRFWEAYQVLVDKLLKYPDLHPFAVDGIRWAKIEKFPYKVLYEIEGELLKVVAVAQVRKKPNYWIQRQWG